MIDLRPSMPRFLPYLLASACLVCASRSEEGTSQAAALPEEAMTAFELFFSPGSHLPFDVEKDEEGFRY
ncbi:hypothetical protein IAU59_007596 [Kwoniella sp. CBS 9459]